MLLKPQKEDYKIIGYYTGKIVTGIGLIMIVPLLTSILFAEWNPALDFAIGIASCIIVGFGLVMACQTDRDLLWMHGMVTASFSWLLATLLAAIPHYLSGHFLSYVDACFDIMSGYTTTGLYLLQDLDHVSYGLNMWRHLLTYLGGQGMIVVAITFLFKGTAGAYRLYVGEGKDERLLPNVIQTTRAIWLISLAYLSVGTIALFVANLRAGLPPLRSFLHGLWIFMGSWSTGGFAPQSQSLLYYHSALIEFITVFIFIIGSYNFALHYTIWRGNYREIFRNIETVSFSSTVTLTGVICFIGLMQSRFYPSFLSLFRFCFYQVVSAHTTTGNMTVYATQFVNNWNAFAVLGIMIAMTIGGSACSTAGGIKGLRVGILVKQVINDINRIFSPDAAVLTEKFHHIRDVILDDQHIRAAGLITMSYMGLYLMGAVAGLFYGYPLLPSLFDSISAASNTGLSTGLTSAAMPTMMKILYILMMWAGRLEFIAVLALIAFIWAHVRGK
ncbi:MAG: TrkH family potassium uptake protein [bacterium]